MNIQRRTVVDRLYRNREYRPPWLWSLVDMLESTHSDTAGSGTRMIVHPTAGGKLRGAHNCGKCDEEIVAAIERYSVAADLRELDGLDCGCKSVWRVEIDTDLIHPVPLGPRSDRRGAPTDLLRAP